MVEARSSPLMIKVDSMWNFFTAYDLKRQTLVRISSPGCCHSPEWKQYNLLLVARSRRSILSSGWWMKSMGNEGESRLAGPRTRHRVVPLPSLRCFQGCRNVPGRMGREDDSLPGELRIALMPSPVLLTSEPGKCLALRQQVAPPQWEHVWNDATEACWRKCA